MAPTSTSIDPELRRIATVLPRGAAGPRVLPMIRRLEPLLQRRRPPENVELVESATGTIRMHHPPEAGPEALPTLLWIHGGGYVIGSPAQDDANCRRFAQKVGIRVAAVSYRRAPEHPFPAGLHDCHDALVWLAGRDDVDADRIAIGGASAGGGLAAALALLARERGEVRPVHQLLSYPMLDDRTARRDDLDEGDFRLWNNRANRFGWRSYLGTEPGGSEVSSLAAPARHDDLTGLPPAWIGVGTCDLFHDEDVAYAERLRAAGVPCELHIAEGAFHGFDGIRPKAAVSQAYRHAQLDVLRSALGTHD